MLSLFTRRTPTIAADRMVADREALAAHWEAARQDAEAAREARSQRVEDNGITWVG